LADLDAFVKERAGSFSMAKRPTDPFGLLQDPAAAPVAPKVVAKTENKFMNIPPTPFADVIDAIHVTAVMPQHQRFLVGSRSIGRGDSFPIHYRDKSLTVQVLKVSAKKIDFRNTATGETASLSLDLLPPGMSRDEGGGTGPPGLQRDNPAAPIEVQIALPPTDAPRVISAKR